jgi:hypothetical protein
MQALDYSILCDGRTQMTEIAGSQGDDDAIDVRLSHERHVCEFVTFNIAMILSSFHRCSQHTVYPSLCTRAQSSGSCI